MASMARPAIRVFQNLIRHQHSILNGYTPKGLHTRGVLNRKDIQAMETEKKLIIKSGTVFDEIAARRKANKESFQTAVAMYISKESIYRRGHVEFLYASLDRMKEFGVAKDLDMYKYLLEIFPKEKMIPKSAWQVEFMHYPKQQQCAIDLMEQMEDNGVIPDHNFGSILKKIFGPNTHAFRKYRRMMYWLPKFKNINPYPVPRELPEDPILLAMLALKRMAVDYENKISVWKTVEVENDPIEDTFIASSQCPMQQTLITKHPCDQPLFVEGGYCVWLRDKSLSYFVLRADPSNSHIKMKEMSKNTDEDLFDWEMFYEEEKPKEIEPVLSIHEQTDGTVLGMCITGSSTKDSLVTWIRYLQQANPCLEQIPIVFTLRTPESEIQVVQPDNGQIDVQTKQ